VFAGGTFAIAPGLAANVRGLDPGAGGLVDIGDGRLTVSGGLSAASLVSAIVAGRGDGFWSGTSGITSTAAARDVALGLPRSIGWLDPGDGSVSFAFAAPGDTNLDWQVDVLDAANMLSAGKYNTPSGARWAEGDFNYDGFVDILDGAAFATSGLFNRGPYNLPTPLAGSPSMIAVPEPTGLTWLLGAAFPAVTRVVWLCGGGRRHRLPSSRRREAARS
jgi:hypothetical protein